MKPKYGIGYGELTFYDSDTEQPLLVVENPDIEINENWDITFKDYEVGEIVMQELKLDKN